jgi:DNA-nicking Smr family endonuclease
MKSPKSDNFNRPFEGLKDLLRAQAPLQTCDAPSSPLQPPATPAAADEEALFSTAMAGVLRAPWNDMESPGLQPLAPAAWASAAESDVEPLRLLVNSGQGFSVADTPEYMEGVGGPTPPGITRRLHRGDFAVQAHLDLHGFSAAAAQDVFDAFMKEAVATGKRTVLIIHGRGLSSPAQPVLKTRVAEWLSTGYWRKWVVAYTSARLCDGGSGASYVLLRRKPVPKRLRRGLRSRAPAAPSKSR